MDFEDSTENSIETKEIKMPPKKLLGILFLNYGTVWFVIALAGFATFIVLGCVVNVKFFVLALIWIFLFIPLVMAFLYFFYGMEPLTVFNATPHKIMFRSMEIRISLIEKEDEAEKHKDYVVETSCFSHCKSGSDYVILFFKKQGWLWLPSDSFESINTFKGILENLQFQSKKQET